MWQRIQTLYLAISAALIAVLLFGTAYVTVDGSESVRYIALQSPWFGILLGLIALMIVIALIAFKVRILQMRLATLSALVALGAQGWLAFLYFSMHDVVFKWTVIFPFVIFISNILAARGCYQDQLMVEAATRIRDSRKRRRR
ncbi:MAG: DUF4293 family protein [Bacteroidales bacterium]|jgi:glucan phosphoethanolaminetransferase (alkaline phosphatase superfamily)|nr:DUF4293 family protein [Bacteroidales bacterium]